MNKSISVALAGNPNSGKTTMFNALTGARQHVGNYPGVTVEKRQGVVNVHGRDIQIIDLPGTYSLGAYSPEELVARDFLVNEMPDVIIDIIDATNLERNLYLAIQLMEIGIPVILSLNMMDEVKKQKRDINTNKLSELMDVPVIESVARSGQGKARLMDEALRIANLKDRQSSPLEISYGPDLDPVIDKMTGIIKNHGFLTNQYPARWTAIKYLEADEQVLTLGNKKAQEVHKTLTSLTQKVTHHLKTTLKTWPEAVIADYRYGYIASLLKQGISEEEDSIDRAIMSDRIDRVLTHRILGPVIMILVLYGAFQVTFPLGEIPMGWLETFFGLLSNLATSLIPEGYLRSMVVSGIIGGVGGVLGFVPLILCLFMVISILEDSGYMARMAYMLDKVLRTFGLHGSSVMPFIVSGGIPGGCAVPGIMATRVMKSKKEKLATIITAPFLTCGAKVPVFIMLSAAFFKGNGARVLFLITLGSWAMVLLVSLILRSTIIKGESTPFVMELPPYRMPTLMGILIHTWERGWEYIKKAGTVILAISILIWAAMTFPGLPERRADAFESMRNEVKQELSQTTDNNMRIEINQKLSTINNTEAKEALKNSIAGRIGIAMEPVSRLAGFDWRTNIALLGGFAAKEVIISSMATAYSLGEIDPESSESLSEKLAVDPGWDMLTAISMIIFVMLYAPCFVTIVVMARESSWKWAGFSLLFNTILAFLLATGVYQAGKYLA